MEVHGVKEKAEPKLDDEFAKDVSEFETLADFRKDLGDKRKDRLEKQARTGFEESLMGQVVDNMTAEIPDAMINMRAQSILDDYVKRVQSQGVDMKDYLAMTGMTADILKEQAMEIAARQVKTELALDAIIAAEKIEVDDKELDAECQKLADQYNMPLDDVKKAVNMDDVRKDVTRQKAGNVVFDSAKVGPAPEPKQAEEQAEEKPAKKATAKKSAKKADEADETEDKPAAKKAAAKKTEDGETEDKPKKAPAKKPAAKKAKTEEDAE